MVHRTFLERHREAWQFLRGVKVPLPHCEWLMPCHAMRTELGLDRACYRSIPYLQDADHPLPTLHSCAAVAVDVVPKRPHRMVGRDLENVAEARWVVGSG